MYPDCLKLFVWNKPADCVLLVLVFGVNGAWWFGGFDTSLGCTVPQRHPISLRVYSSRSGKELECSITLQALDTNAANPVAINRYQYVRCAATVNL